MDLVVGGHKITAIKQTIGIVNKQVVKVHMITAIIVTLSIFYISLKNKIKTSFHHSVPFLSNFYKKNQKKKNRLQLWESQKICFMSNNLVWIWLPLFPRTQLFLYQLDSLSNVFIFTWKNNWRWLPKSNWKQYRL